MRNLIVFLILWLAAAAAMGADPARGRTLYQNGPPGLGFGCSFCHGNSFPAAGINNPAAISSKISAPGSSGMNIFQGFLSAADLEDIAAYMGNPNLIFTTTTTTTTTTATTTTTLATITTTTQGAVTLNFVPGFSLVGNSSGGALKVADVFADQTKAITVWKWLASAGKWAFYAPSLLGQALSEFAAGKGYEVLTTINGGEGFWVNAKIAFSAQLPAGAPPSSASLQSLAPGFNLIASGDNKTPSQFNLALSPTPPETGVVPLNITTLWAWDAVQSNWYFYAPSLEARGAAALTDYINSKNYLDFTASGKVLAPGVGFWVNRP